MVVQSVFNVLKDSEVGSVGVVNWAETRDIFECRGQDMTGS